MKRIKKQNKMNKYNIEETSNKTPPCNFYIKVIEALYQILLKYLLSIINPIKRLIIRTDCEVHLFNNIHALNLLKKYNYKSEYNFFHKYIEIINDGSYWADQNFKSMNHFYNPHRKIGLFGQKNALYLAKNYYSESINYYLANDIVSSMFYLGATIHLIQDVTIPQHVYIRLLDSHRQYENFVKDFHDLNKDYVALKKPIILSSVYEYINFNAKQAIKLNKKFKTITPLKLRFHKVTLRSLPLAQRTTAGLLITFYKFHTSKL
jgi:phospholipase C